jgi:hypothetical protein
MLITGRKCTWERFSLEMLVLITWLVRNSDRKWITSQKDQKKGWNNNMWRKKPWLHYIDPHVEHRYLVVTPTCMNCCETEKKQTCFSAVLSIPTAVLDFTLHYTVESHYLLQSTYRRLGN